MPSRTLITILTWNRLDYTKNTIKTLFEHNSRDMPDILFMDNGSTDGTIEWLLKKNFEFLRSKTNLGIFLGTRLGWLEAVNRNYDFILNLQNDFPCLAPIPFNDVEQFLDENKDTGFVQLNRKKKKAGRDINKLTGKQIKWSDWQQVGNTFFAKGNRHFNFNPALFSTSIVKPIVEDYKKTRERQLMEGHQRLGLKAAKLKDPDPCFQTIIRPRVDGWIH